MAERGTEKLDKKVLYVQSGQELLLILTLAVRPATA